jgi:hypothetical protein
MKSKVKISNPDDFDILSSIWIISCNDENPIMTYEGIKHRLNLNDDFNLKELISSRADLFRLKIPIDRLDVWKKDMLNGCHQPNWIKEIKDKESREKKINSFCPDDIFRNQFRTKSNSEKCPIEIIDWGLQHINRLRLAINETFENRIKKWSSVWIPIASLIVAFSAVISSSIIQNKTQEVQTQLKKYEVSFKPKQENYSIFLCTLLIAFDCAREKNHNLLLINLDKLEMSYYNMEPFLCNAERKKIWQYYQEFSKMCLTYEALPYEKRTDSVNSKYLDLFINYKIFFRDILFPNLFEKL